MIARMSAGWQTITADLALILFLVTAQASVSQPADASVVPPAPPAAETTAETTAETAPAPTPHAVEGSGSAIFRPGPGLDLQAWLEETRTDDRQSVTAIVRFPVGGRGAALDEAAALMTVLETAGARSRLVLEPAREAESLVVIGYEGAL